MTLTAFPQSGESKQLTKFEEFSSKTGSIIKFVDTVYNKVVLDSINYNIHIKDSTIVKLKQKVEYETEQAISANDSDAIKQFYELAGAD